MPEEARYSDISGSGGGDRMLKDNRYKDMECVMHFGNNRKQILWEFQNKRVKLAARYIQKQDITILRQIDLREYLKAG